MLAETVLAKYNTIPKTYHSSGLGKFILKCSKMNFGPSKGYEILFLVKSFHEKHNPRSFRNIPLKLLFNLFYERVKCIFIRH